MSEQSRWDTAKRIVDLSSGVAVIFTLIFIALQWREMHVGSQDTHELAVSAKAQADAAKAQAEIGKDTLAEVRKEATDTHDLAVAAKAQADAAESQATALSASVKEAHALALAARIANENAVNADRPWIGSATVSAEPLEAGKAGTASVTVINSGRGPARLLSFKASMHVFDTFPTTPPYDDVPTWMHGSHSILLPGMIGTNSFPFSPFGSEIMKLVRDGKLTLYIYGVVEYEDLRVKNSRHTTKLCAFWTADRVKGSAAFVNCPEYNEAD
jgi:hypothetical protein